MNVRRGDLIGYVGTTGNAPRKAAHLHFAVFRVGAERQWWKGDRSIHSTRSAGCKTIARGDRRRRVTLHRPCYCGIAMDTTCYEGRLLGHEHMKMYIGGRWVESSDGRLLDNLMARVVVEAPSSVAKQLPS